MAVAVRLAVNGTQAEFERLRPLARLADGSLDPEFDEDGLAEDLAALGYIEVPRND